jgi:predicted transcriptional regulator
MKKSDFNFDIEKVTLLFYGNLSEKDKRLFVGLEAMRVGYYGVCEVSKRFQVHKHTIRKGQKELLTEKLVPAERVRESGGGRKKKSKQL